MSGPAARIGPAPDELIAWLRGMRPATLREVSLRAMKPTTWGRRAARAQAEQPLTLALLAVLLVTTIWLGQSSDPTHVLRSTSTNIANLTHSPITALIESALFLDDGGWLKYALALFVTLGLIERRRGTLMALGVFASAHLIVTMLTEGGVWIGIRAGLLRHAERFQLDVGVSYGLWSCAFAAIALIPRRWRGALVALLSPFILVPLVRDFDMTAIGHVLSALVGLAWWPTLLRGIDRHPRRTVAAANR